jgi:hypothetical protein
MQGRRLLWKRQQTLQEINTEENTASWKNWNMEPNKKVISIDLILTNNDLDKMFQPDSAQHI